MTRIGTLIAIVTLALTSCSGDEPDAIATPDAGSGPAVPDAVEGEDVEETSDPDAEPAEWELPAIAEGAEELPPERFDSTDLAIYAGAESISFIMPSGNFACDVYGTERGDGTGDAPMSYECVSFLDSSWPPGPEPIDELPSPEMADDLSCFHVFEGDSTGLPQWTCHGGVTGIYGSSSLSTVEFQDRFAFPYDHYVTFRGVTCVSREDGLRCESEAGHGFHVAREVRDFY